MTDQSPPPAMPDEPGFGALLGEVPSPKPAETPAYRVLARKYRPRDFSDLIGQDAMVRTLSNAFASGRIPQAWMLTGVRGVGKTTTARILARGLNYQRPDGSGGPTVELSDPGLHCQTIIEGRHVDVMEIDAASNNGVDYIRQINDQVRYAPVLARYKVYIIDEVHMMTGQAFNAFLKTLEEPPPHAKFIFATTEIRKVPVTILSRCQRFDLRRIEPGVLVAHLARICAVEGVEVDQDALQALARAAEGSVRDSMSLLDQAIAHAGGRITLETVRDMLGLADRARVIDLFEAVMRGDLAAALGELRGLYDVGADPHAVMTELADFTHLVTRLKIVPEAADDPALTPDEKTRGQDFARRLSVRVLSRTWQMLLKAVQEVRDAGRPLAAAEMALVRLAYAADLPTPDEALRALANQPAAGPAAGNGNGGPDNGGARAAIGGGGPPMQAAAPRTLPPRPASGPQLATSQSRPQPAPTPAAARPEVVIGTLEDIVALAAKHRDIQIQAAVQRDVRLVRLEPGRLEFALRDGGDAGLANILSRKLKDWTGQTWMVAMTSAPGAPTLRERQEQDARERQDDASRNPTVQAILSRFPGARIVDVRRSGAAEEDGGGEIDEGLAASLESGEGLYDMTDEDSLDDIDF